VLVRAGVVGDEATHGPQDPWGVVAELDHAGAMTPARDDQQALGGHPGGPVHQLGLLPERLVIGGDDEQHRHPQARHRPLGIDSPEPRGA
jgi:hypothetical protein